MSLTERLQAAKPNRKPKLDEWLVALPSDERAAIEAAGKDPDWTVSALEKFIRAEGVQVSDEAIRRWQETL